MDDLREELTKKYRAESGTVQKTCMFYGEPLYIVYIWLHGEEGRILQSAKEGWGKIVRFRVRREDVQEFPELGARKYIDIFEGANAVQEY